MRIAALVITYNRCTLLKECISGLRNQRHKLDKIVVVDNGSTDESPNWLDEQKDLVVIHQDNQGSSGGQYVGLMWCYNAGFDWVWTMDDDVEPQLDALANLVKEIDPQVGCIVPGRTYTDGTMVAGHEQVINTRWLTRFMFLGPSDKYIEKMTFEGPLISRKVIPHSLRSLKDYFILYDDVDFAYKLSRMSKIVFCPAALMIKKIKILEDFFVPGNEWKQYYRFRNQILFVLNNFQLHFVVPMIYLEFLNIRAVLHHVSKRPRMYSYVSVYCRALLHAFTGKRGEVYTRRSNPWCA